MKTKVKHRVPQFIAVFLAVTCSVSSAQTYDPGSGFSASVNPSGVWSYGYSLTLGSALILHTTSDTSYGFPTWRTNIGLGDPIVGYNPTSQEVSFGTFTLGPGELALHPGPNNEIAVLRFTAPSAGEYHVFGSFFGRDHNGTTTDVHLLADGLSVFDGSVSGYGPGTGPSFDKTVLLEAGGVLDFAVGYGNGNYFYDTTALTAQIVAASSFSILAITREGNDVRLAWKTPANKSNFVQATSGAANGSYSNSFADISPATIVPGAGTVTTNYVDVGGATNAPARYYRIRLVP